MPTAHRFSPKPRTRGERGIIARRIRHLMGVSSDPTPSTRDVLTAGRELAALVELSTDGELRLVLEYENGGTISFSDAIVHSEA